MTTPGSLLLLLLPAAILAAAAGEQQQSMPRLDCPDKCGDIDIPFPFGIGSGCFRDGFEVVCKHSRAFLADKKLLKKMIYRNTSDEYTLSYSLLELVSISLATGEARAYAYVSYACSFTGDGYEGRSEFSSTRHDIDFSDTAFAVSWTRNVLIGLGFDTDAKLSMSYKSGDGAYNRYDYDLNCHAGDPSPVLSSVFSAGTNGSCAGAGCCRAVPVASDNAGKYFSVLVEFVINRRWFINPCMYAMMVEKSWYDYSTLDLYGNMTLLKKFPRGVHLAIDFAAGNSSCPAGGQPQPPPAGYACVSRNSACANASYTYEPGYICKCLDNYAGNPYVADGCQDIDECKQPEVYPCSNGGICKNRQGGYDCPCKFGMKDDGHGGTCSDVFPRAAKAAVGAIGGILLIVVVSFFIILHKEKRKMKEFYDKNGGPTLEKANVIKLFKKGDLKPILKNSNLIGKGCFGEVYKGLLDNKLVAIKKPINGSALESDQFANEVMIQSQVIHKNIVRLIGCCLEVDAPMLVYEFISQGSLHDILHNNNSMVALNLNTRLDIAVQSADGLAYMHSKANVTILHGDVKPANILLDDNFEPKISDFGISRLIARDRQHTGSVIGDMNYMDPVYLQEGLLSEKSDVYSFGIVILELISGRRAIHSENNSLVKRFLEAHKKQQKATDLFDKEIALTEDLELLDSLAGMAVECLSLDLDGRPSMMDIVERLLILSRSRKV